MNSVFSDPSSNLGISTESDSVSPETEEDEVAKFDLAPKIYIFLNMEASDASASKARYYTYVLLSLKDGNLYIGYTQDLKNRLIKHASGQVAATKHRRPLKLIHYEYFINVADTKAREKFLKSEFGRKQLKEALKRTLKEFV